MRYEVQKQIEDIDKAIGTITMYQIPNMKIPQKEMYEALKKAESCMKLVMHELCQQDKTIKEIYRGDK